MYTQNKGRTAAYLAGREEGGTMLIHRALQDHMGIQWGRMGMVGCALLVLSGCVAYHGPTKTSTNREVIRSSVGSPSMKVTAMVRNSSLIVHVDKVEPIEEIEKEIKTSQYATYEKGGFLHGLTRGIPGLSMWPANLLVCKDIVCDPPEATDEPYVPVLSAVACRIFPWVWCVGSYLDACPTDRNRLCLVRPRIGKTEESWDEQVVSRRTESVESAYWGPIWVLVGPEKVRLETDGRGDATMPLSQEAVRTLLNGHESLLLRVSVRE